MDRYINADMMIADAKTIKKVAEGISIDGIIKYLGKQSTTEVVSKAEYDELLDKYEHLKGSMELVGKVKQSGEKGVCGEWKKEYEHAYIGDGCAEWVNFYCSQCETPCSIPSDFCPHCGADMRGGKK